jgi:predicted dehydrogenase
MTSAAKRPQLALIGISGYGRVHLQLARECRERGEVDIVAVTVINPQDEQENMTALLADGCTIYSDYREMLREFRGRIDLCLIPTGIHWHARMTIAALEAGANVLVEKPLAGSSSEIEAIRAAEAKAGRFVAVGFQDYYEPGTTWLQGELQRGAIGDIRSVRVLGLWPRDRAYFTRNNWAGRLKVDGVPVYDSPLNNAFAHFVMLSLFFVGADTPAMPITLDGVELLRAHAIESFDTCVVTAHTPKGVRLWFGTSHACRDAVEPEIRITGSAGEACWRYESEAWWRNATGTTERRQLLDAYGARRAMITAALRRLRDPAVPVCTTAMAGQHTALIEAVHRATPIVALPADQIRWAGPNGAASAGPEVPGLAETLHRAFAEEKLLSACGFTPAALRDRVAKK